MEIDNPDYYNGQSPETDKNFDGDELIKEIREYLSKNKL